MYYMHFPAELGADSNVRQDPLNNESVSLRGITPVEQTGTDFSNWQQEPLCSSNLNVPNTRSALTKKKPNF